MKKRMLVSVALGIGALALTGGAALAGSAPGSGIIGSLHDLSDDGGYPGGGVGSADVLSRVCIYCHAPHHTQKPGNFTEPDKYLPLWNRPVSQATSFTMYSNGTNPGWGKHLSQAMTQFTPTTKPGFVSLLCLSCHDGTVALNVYGSTQMSDATWDAAQGKRVIPSGSKGIADYNTPQPAGGAYLMAGSQYNIGGVNMTTVDLSNHHPIGFDYDKVWQADDEIANPNTEFGYMTGSLTGVKIADVLYNGKMECVTCHDVHNSTANMGEKFLWVSNQDSNFCCTCHLKCNNGNKH